MERQEQSPAKQEFIEKSKTFWNPNKTQFWQDQNVDLVIDRREGYLLYDMDGRRLIDVHLNGGTYNIGHRHPELIEVLTEAYGEPFGCSSALAMLRVSRAVRPLATVLLTGESGVGKDLIARASIEPKKRRATRPTKGSQQRRMEHKTQHKRLKQLRGRVRED